MPFSSGHRLAHYEILELVGKGGMGEVYRARDGKLDRRVAIKVLPDEFARDEERLRRFQREAKVLASLNHTNIASIYGLEQSGSTHYLVLEFVEGETLGERISRGPITTDETLEIAAKIAEALEAAHELGIVHRDLKPANIKLTPDNKVKVLDFGLAKALTEETPDADSSMSPTITRAATRDGVILGTAAYMSPEQAKGKKVDRRADIWAYGVVLFEMLTGKRLFAGDTVAETIAAILTKEPDWSLVPPELHRLLSKCLEKNPQRRLRDIGDAWLLVEPLPVETVTEETRRSVLPWAVAALVTGLLAGAGAFSVFAPVIEPEPVLFVESAPEGTQFLEAPLPSPDGRHLAMRVRDADGQTKIWVRTLGSEQARALEGTDGASVMFWSPDSEHLAFHASGELRRISRAGAENQLIAALPVGAGVWTPDNDIIVSSRSQGLVRIPDTGGKIRPILNEGGVDYRGLDIVPDGLHLLIQQFGGETGIHTFDLTSGNRRLLIPGANSNVRYVAPDLLVYEERRVLLAQRFDSTDMSFKGDPFPVAQDVDPQHFFGSAGGTLSFLRGATDSDRLTWLDRSGHVIGTVGPEGLYSEVYLSPGGRWMMFVRSDPATGNRDLWVQDVAGSAPRRFTTDPDVDHLAAFSRDDEEIAWEAHAGGVLNMMRRRADGSTDAVVVRPWSRPGGPDDWSPDRRFILYSSNDGATRFNLWLVPVEGGGEPILLIESEFDDSQGQFSPDGGWLAYTSDASGEEEVYLQRLDDLRLVGGPQIVSSHGGEQPRWRSDGKELFFLSHGRLMVADVDLDAEVPATTPRELFVIGEPRSDNFYAVTPDGQRFLAIVTESKTAAVSATVVLNFAAGLEDR